MKYEYTDQQIDERINQFFPSYLITSPKGEEKNSIHLLIETSLSLINFPPYGKKAPSNHVLFMKKRASLIDSKYAPLFISFVDN